MKSLRWSRWGLLSMCCAAGALAAEGENSTELFDKLDANKDGQVTAEEVPEEHRPHLERLLRKGDKDENKSLSKEEWEAAHKPEAEPEVGGPSGKEGRPNPGQMFERMDANKDGKLQKSEIPAEAPPKIREMLDKVFEASGKDELSREELLSSMGKMAKDKAGPPGGKGGEPGKMIERLKKLDKNGDGKVTTDEFPAEGAERLQGLMSKIGGGDSIDIKKAEEFAERQAAKQAAKAEKKNPGEPGKKKKRPGLENEVLESEVRPEGVPPEGDRPPQMGDDELALRPEGRGPGPEGRGPGEHGHHGHGPHGGIMSLLDENHDERLSREEFSRAATFFGDLDRNRDGFVDGREMMSMPGPGDGGPHGPEGRGPRADRGFGPPPGEGPEGRRGPGGGRPDGEGPEGREMRDGERPRPEGGDGESGRPGFGGPRPEGGPGGRFNPEEMFKRMDKDGDGTLSKEEAPGRMKEHFDEIDTDKDGKLTKDELKAHREKRMNERGGRPGGEGPDGPRPGRPEGEGEKPAGDAPKDAAPAQEKPAEEAPKA
ncbi:MAG: EF-hand domain-containing protein [Planctomycetaceae bacterium]